ncbi:MAG: extracellular solute-binding protein, partial [Phycisphaerae bacterium]
EGNVDRHISGNGRVSGPHSWLGGGGVRSLAVLAIVIGFAPLTVLAQPWGANPAGSGQPVTLYCSIDEPFGRMVLDKFMKKTGIPVRVEFDTEAGKTTGLFRKIMLEKQSGSPRADVFWSSELFNTILLARRGALQPYESPSASDIPQRYKDEDHHWTAHALRARVLAYNPKIAQPEGSFSWETLGGESMARYTAMANPLFGTTRGHVAAMFALWGEDRARKFLTGFRKGDGFIADGNSAAVRKILAGDRPFAMTDTDDVWVAKESGAEIEMIYPDMGDGGTLLIPCSVAMIAGRPENENAKKLVDYLLSPEVERLLGQSSSRNIPVRQSERNRLDMKLPPETKVSFEKIVDMLEVSERSVRDILLR